jgi:ribonuclease HI
MKINVDSSISKTSKEGAVGAVCRREDGVFVEASSLTIRDIDDPATTETLACREALALAEDLQLQKVAIASDCLSVINNMERQFAGSYSMILQEIKLKAATFAVVSFSHESRFSNSQPHKVACSALVSNLGRQLCLLSPPDGLCVPMNCLDK